MSLTRAAERAWEIEVDIINADLIEKGTPPWQAAREAQRIVSDRRKRRAVKEYNSDDVFARMQSVIDKNNYGGHD